jgi:hypothetical protein
MAACVAPNPIYRWFEPVTSAGQSRDAEVEGLTPMFRTFGSVEEMIDCFANIKN